MKKTQSPNNQKAVDFFIKTKQKRAMYIDIPIESEQIRIALLFLYPFLDFEFRKDDDASVEKKNIELRGIEE